MASASSSETAFWSPVASAVAMLPDGPCNCPRICWPNRSRSESSPRGSAGRSTSTAPSERPTAPRPRNQASRAKSCDPGRAIGGGGASRARTRIIAPAAIPDGARLCLDGHANAVRQCGLQRHEGQAQVALARDRFDPFDLGVECRDHRPLQPRRPNPFRTQPNQAASKRKRKAEPANRPLQPPTFENEPRNCEGRRRGRGPPAIRPARPTQTRTRSPLRSPRPAMTAAGRAHARGSFPPPRALRENAPSKSPEHAVEDAHPLC